VWREEMKNTKRLLVGATVMSALSAMFFIFLALYLNWFLHVRPDITPQVYPQFIHRMNLAFYMYVTGSVWFIVMTTLLILAILRLRNLN
jgi:hypothetical protein